MIFPERVFGQVLGPDDPLRPRELADPLRDVLADVADEVLVAVAAALERHERGHGLARVLVGLPDHGRLGDLASSETIADSISAVDMRWPETLSTSSMRPMIQK